MKKILSLILLTCFCSMPIVKASEIIIIGSDGRAVYENKSLNEFKNMNVNVTSTQLQAKGIEMNQANSSKKETLMAIGKKEDIPTDIINIVADCDNIPDDKKLSVMKTLNKHYKHLKSRGDAYELAYFTGGTIIIPLITLIVVGIKEVIYIPSGINAKQKLKLTNSTMKLIKYNNGQCPSFYPEISKIK